MTRFDGRDVGRDRSLKNNWKPGNGRIIVGAARAFLRERNAYAQAGCPEGHLIDALSDARGQGGVSPRLERQARVPDANLGQ